VKKLVDVYDMLVDIETSTCKRKPLYLAALGVILVY